MEKIRPEDNMASCPDAAASAENRRQYRRYAAEVSVRFRELRPASNDEPMHIGQTLNISRGGLFVKTTHLYSLSTLLELNVAVLTSDTRVRNLTMTAAVIWVSFDEAQPGMGVEFRDIDEETRQALLAHAYRGELQSLRSDPDDPDWDD